MIKFLAFILGLSCLAVFAKTNSEFQKFDNEYNLGYSMYQTTLTNGAHNQNLQQSQALQLEVERLFDIGVWMNVAGDFVVSTNSLGNKIPVGQESSPFSQDFNLGGINAKVGYGYIISKKYLQFIPYGQIGRNTNLARSTVINNNQNNITNDYFITVGIGVRLEYRINDSIFVYIDQAGNYNWDQSGPVNGVQPQNNVIYTSTLGAKFNIWRNLQLGLKGFYNNYQYMAAAPTLPYDPTGSSIYQPQYNIGGMFTIGLTY